MFVIPTLFTKEISLFSSHSLPITWPLACFHTRHEQFIARYRSTSPRSSFIYNAEPKENRNSSFSKFDLIDPKHHLGKSLFSRMKFIVFDADKTLVDVSRSRIAPLRWKNRLRSSCRSNLRFVFHLIRVQFYKTFPRFCR